MYISHKLKWTDINLQKKKNNKVQVNQPKYIHHILTLTLLRKNMSVLAHVKRFFANTIHGYGEVFRHRYVDNEVVSRKLMCDIRAFGKQIMDIPDETDI